MKNDDYKGRAITLGGTNYGETDRILYVLLEDGRQISVLGKGLRRGKSKLAGGTQILAVNHLEIHFSRSKGMAILTGTRMEEFFARVLGDFERLGVAYELMRRIRRAENVENARFFGILRQALEGLNDKSMPVMLARGWFFVNFGLVMGWISDLYYSTDGEKLRPDERYGFDIDEKGFYVNKSGKIDSEVIKFLRFLAGEELRRAKSVRDWHGLLEKVRECGIIRI